MRKGIFDKINQISVLNNPARFKILLALFNSDIVIGNKKIGSHSHTFSELSTIVDLEGSDLSYHLDILKSGDLIRNSKGEGYHITNEGKDILNMFGVTPKLVKEQSEKLK